MSDLSGLRRKQVLGGLKAASIFAKKDESTAWAKKPKDSQQTQQRLLEFQNLKCTFAEELHPID